MIFVSGFHAYLHWIYYTFDFFSTEMILNMNQGFHKTQADIYLFIENPKFSCITKHTCRETSYDFLADFFIRAWVGTTDIAEDMPA